MVRLLSRGAKKHVQVIPNDLCDRAVMGKNHIGHASELFVEPWAEDGQRAAHAPADLRLHTAKQHLSQPILRIACITASLANALNFVASSGE